MSERVERIVIERTEPGVRLDVFLRRLYPPVSRGTFQRLMEEGHLLCNGAPTKPNHSPKAGEVIEIRWPDAKPAEAQAQELALDILYEDEHIVVINKGPDMVVHPAAGHEDSTLVNALLHHCHGQLSGIGGVARPGIVHRLDKETSGCLVVAKNDAAHLALSAQFASREVEKVYQAILCGELPVSRGDIKAAIARHPTHRKRMAVVTGGRDAWTSYRVLEKWKGATWVEALLHTGRTHQIRVHFQSIGYPLVGDATYGKRQNKTLEDLRGITASRQMLHAWKLVFKHPVSGQKVAFEAPLPADFSAVLDRLRKG